MWYLAEILFAEPQQDGRQAYQCESCNVVFDAHTAVDAYRKAIAWGQAYAAEPPAAMRLLGVSHLTTIGERLEDGVEVCGRFFESPDVWEQAVEWVPPLESLKAVRWEQGRDSPMGELLSPDQIAQRKRVWTKVAEYNAVPDRPRE